MFTNLYNLFDSFRAAINSKIAKRIDSIFLLSPKLSEKKIKNSVQKRNLEITKEIKVFYRFSNGFKLDWKINSPEENRQIEGENEIFPLDQLFTEKSFFYSGRKELHQSIWLQKTGDTYKNKDFFIVDHCQNGNFLLCKIENKTPLLYWYNAFGTLNKMTLTFEQYIHKSFEYGAINLWQEYFVEDFSNSPIKTIPDTIAKELKYIDSSINTSPFELELPINKNSNFNKYLKSKTKFNYYQFIATTLKELKKNKTFKKVKFSLNKGASIASLRRFYATTGFELPLDLIEFYYQINGFKLSWEKELNGKKYFGKINILSLEDLMGGKTIKEWNNEVYKNQYWNENEPKNKNLKRFENIEGTGMDIAIEISKNKYQLNYFDGETTTINLSIQKYIETILYTLGVDTWHLLYFSNEKNIAHIDKKELEELK